MGCGASAGQRYEEPKGMPIDAPKSKRHRDDDLHSLRRPSIESTPTKRNSLREPLSTSPAHTSLEKRSGKENKENTKLARANSMPLRGDEIAPEPVSPGKIRRSSSFALAFSETKQGPLGRDDFVEKSTYTSYGVHLQQKAQSPKKPHSSLAGMRQEPRRSLSRTEDW